MDKISFRLRNSNGSLTQLHSSQTIGKNPERNTRTFKNWVHIFPFGLSHTDTSTYAYVYMYVCAEHTSAAIDIITLKAQLSLYSYTHPIRPPKSIDMKSSRQTDYKDKSMKKLESYNYLHHKTTTNHNPIVSHSISIFQFSLSLTRCLRDCCRWWLWLNETAGFLLI